MKTLSRVLLVVFVTATFGLGLGGCVTGSGHPAYGPGSSDSQHGKQLKKQRQRHLHRNLR